MPRSLRNLLTPRQLRAQWEHGSMAGGWTFPSDWHLPAVEAVCEAVCAGVGAAVSGTAPAALSGSPAGSAEVRPAVERLGAERAAAGVSLAETLADIDVLADLAPGHAEDLRRAVSLGWAEGSTVPAESVVDALTGLASAQYLRVRLGEVYRAAEVEGSSAGATHALVVARLGRAGSGSWMRSLPMILVGDVMRTVFAGGQSLARIGPVVAVALTARSTVLGRQARLLAELLATRIEVSDDADVLPQVWIEHLPPGRDAAVAMVDELGR